VSKTSFAFSAVSVSALLCACASQPEPAEALQPAAVRAAQQRGASELGCPAATAAVLSKETSPEPQGTGWYEYPHRAQFAVRVSGCGRNTTYSVACDNRNKSCVAGPMAVASAPPPDLADTLQPGAVKVAQQQGASELGCPAATAQVLRKETIQEPQGTGWYEPPHRAVYAMDLAGCGKRTTYLVACDDRKNACVAGAPRRSAPQGDARGTTDHRLVRGSTSRRHIIDVAGCSKRTSYLVACNGLKKTASCTAGSVQSPARD